VSCARSAAARRSRQVFPRASGTRVRRPSSRPFGFTSPGTLGLNRGGSGACRLCRSTSPPALVLSSRSKPRPNLAGRSTTAPMPPTVAATVQHAERTTGRRGCNVID
jgi:hypothetical protein